MTDDVKKAAEEWANARMIDGSLSGKGYMPALTTSFLAGDAHGFARAVKMLESADAFQFYCEETHEGPGVRPHEWAKWLKEQEKGEG